MEIQQRILNFVVRTNWILFAVASIVGLTVSSHRFAFGIISGGLITTINFHLLHRTLKKAFIWPHHVSIRVVLSKYYMRFIASSLIIFILISKQYVNPIGLFIGLSIVVASITIATMCEFKKLIFKEAI